jgi:hypothetical protein
VRRDADVLQGIGATLLARHRLLQRQLQRQRYLLVNRRARGHAGQRPPPKNARPGFHRIPRKFEWLRGGGSSLNNAMAERFFVALVG